MNKEEQEQLLKEYPYLARTLNHNIILSEETSKYYKSFPVILGKRTQLAIDLLCSDFIYEKYTSKLIDGTLLTSTLNVFEIYFGDTLVINSFSKIELFKVLSYLMNEQIFVPSSKEKERFNALKQSVSLENLISERNNFQIRVDNIPYKISSQTIIDFISLSPSKRKAMKMYANIPIKHMAYLAVHFIKDTKLLDNYEVSDKIKTSIESLESYQEIDFESTNQYLKNDDPNEQKISINPELKSKILESIPEGLDNLQKAIFIYMKMCEILTYDDEFYAVNQQGVVAFKHEKIDHINEITPSNNRVVCYEFNAIYSVFLKQLGFNYRTISRGYMDDFGGGHAFLTFKSGEYIIKVDSVTGVLNGDIPRVKQKLPLEGIIILNKNKDTKEKFKAELKRMEGLYYKIGKEPTFEETLKAYEQSSPNITIIPFSEKLAIFFTKLKNNNYAQVDRLGYIQILKKTLFSQLELDNNISISYIRNNHPLPDLEAESIVVIAIDDDISDETKYYIYNARLGLNEIEKEELQERFDNGHYDYINPKSKPNIPGIKKEVIRNVRRINQNK